jgi:hypothetical protein
MWQTQALVRRFGLFRSESRTGAGLFDLRNLIYCASKYVESPFPRSRERRIMSISH